MYRNSEFIRFLDSYAESGTMRLHMPAHQGKSLNSALSMAYQLDITEIFGADSLFEADGIILEGEKKTARLYGSGSCCWSAGGSTLCIQAMLAKMRTENRTIISARTVHRAFLNACILLGLSVEWVFPASGDVISGNYELSAFEERLQKLAERKEKACVYVTSPDYRGHMQEIAGLAELCKRYDAKLLVDNAHGAHLAFLKENCHPMQLGADYCCDSFHKMLPSLTGAAVLHSRDDDAAELKQYMQMFGSTSSSYLILRSIAEAVEWLENVDSNQQNEKRTLMSANENVKLVEQNALALRERIPFDWIGEEPFHLTVSADGINFAEQLRKQGAEPEYADRTCCVMLLSPLMTECDFRRLECVLRACKPLPPMLPPPLPKPPKTACEMRRACFAESERIPLQEAEGRICATVQVPCPPAVPMVMSGERIDSDWIRYMQFWGLKEIAVCELR